MKKITIKQIERTYNKYNGKRYKLSEKEIIIFKGFNSLWDNIKIKIRYNELKEKYNRKEIGKRKFNQYKKQLFISASYQFLKELGFYI